MAKEFKNFDTMFSKEELAATRKRYGINSDIVYADGEPGSPKSIKKWENSVLSWTNQQIREAVYLVPSSLDWQRFRVSLKGLSTQEKLYMLDKRLGEALMHVKDEQESIYECCRIDNYIGALVRGGQLDTDYNIKRN